MSPAKRREESPHAERRSAPRVATEFPISLSHDTREILGRTRNLSASGAYCTLTHFLPPMTKLQIRLELPGRPRPSRIACQGVVVRVEPPSETPRRSQYDVAIFFNDIADADRAMITHYVQQHLRVTRPRDT